MPDKYQEEDIADRIARSESRIFKAVFPNTTNHYDTLFGGTAMQLMDEVAFITATRLPCLRRRSTSSILYQEAPL